MLRWWIGSARSSLLGHTQTSYEQGAPAQCALKYQMYDRHVAAAETMASSVKKINENCAIDKGIQDKFDDIDRLFDELGDE